jgi:hypothetical protein
MPIVTTDWSITRSTGAVRYIGDDHGGGAPSYATVIEFHRFLQDLADDASSTGDDEIDITDENPSSRSTDNIITLLGVYNIDDTAAEHLYDGSIIQTSGAEIYDGIVNFGNDAVQIQILQNGGIVVDDWWNFGGAGLNADAAQGVSHRFMIKTRTGGVDVDGRRLVGTARRFGFTYTEFGINGTSRGNNVLALSDSNDLNNNTADATVATWTAITNNSEGYIAIDVDNDGNDEFFYSEWDKATFTINQFYERMKWLTREGSTETIYGINGELFRGITHQFSYDNEVSGPFSEPETITWSGGSGQLLAVDDQGVTGTIWMQLLTGTVPADNTAITGTTSSATADVVGTVTERATNFPFIGASTGSALIGAFGVGVEATDLTNADLVFDLTNTQRTPPNFVTFNVGGLITAEDRVLVGPWDGSTTDNEGNPAIDVDQFTLNGALSGGEATVTVNGVIPADTPSTGTIRIFDGDQYIRVTYTGFSVSNFTGCTGTPAALDAANTWISYVDDLAGAATESFTVVFTSGRSLVVKVRDGGGTPIREFISSSAIGANGGSVTAIRTSDA